MIVIHATFPIDSQHREEATELMQELAEQSRTEAGVKQYRVAADIEDRNTFRFFEQYEDEAAFGKHAETEHFEEFESALPELLAGEPTVTRFDVEAASDLDL